MKLIRQGDVLFIPVEPGTLTGFDKAPVQPAGIIQEGEATGHHHRIETLADANVYRPETWSNRPSYVVTGEHGARVVHEEHAAVTLEPMTTYRVHIAREFDYARHLARRVYD